MGKARLVPYSYEHWPSYVDNAKAGPAYAIIDREERVLAVGGLMLPWKTLGLLWFDISLEGRRRIRDVWPLVVQQVRAWWALDFGLLRMEGHCDSADPRAIRTAKHLGLERESTLRKWGPDGRDHEMMVLVR